MCVCIYICICIYICKDQFWLKPITRMDPGPKSPNNKFVESGRKSYSKSRIKILIYSVKWKESHMHTYKKYPQTWHVSMIDNEELFLFIVVFFPHFPLFFLLYFFFCPPFLWIFFRIIYYCFCTISSIHVWVRCWESFFAVLPRLSLNLLLLAVRLLVYCSWITSTLMRSES